VRQRTSGAVDHRFNLSRTGERHADNFCAVDNLCDAPRPSRAGVLESARDVTSLVVDGELVTPALDPKGHRAAHIPQTDERNPHRHP
jgi:hypothetical protein